MVNTRSHMGARRQRLTPSGVVIQSVKDAGTVVGGGDVRAAVWSRLHSRRACRQRACHPQSRP
eukprot:scaffold25438_cov46-Phaeocystis_antarctica.AAC.1